MKNKMPEDADWINPIMVRYFRTRLRSKAFVVCYMALMLMLVIAVFGVIHSASVSSHAARSDAGFLYFLTFVPTILLPLSAYAAFRQEISGNTLELLLVTNLLGKNIAWGAWQTFFSLAVLWQAVLFPIWVLFYFTHGADIVESLATSCVSLLVVAPLIMCGLWAGTLSNGFKRFFGAGFWLLGYMLSLGIGMGVAFDTMGSSASEFTGFILFGLHGLAATAFTRFLLSDALLSTTHEGYYVYDAA
ncbi:MAG: hypothetical protein ACPGN3_02855 [Opitutales bacterium]